MQRSILPAILILSIPGMAAAENQKGQILINPAISYQYFDSELNLEEAPGVGLGLEYRFGSHWAAEIAAFESKADHDFDSRRDTDISQYKLDALYYFSKEATVQPYLGFGVGHAEFSGVYDDETQANAGGGIRFNFSNAWSARWDLRGIYSLDENQADAITSLGISYTFGAIEKMPEPVAEPVVLDSDGDGVLDNADKCPGTAAGVVVDSQGCATDADNDGIPDGRDICEGTPAGAQVDVTGCPSDSDGDGILDGIDQCPDTSAGARVDELGCVGITEKVAVETISLSIQFPTNSAVVMDQYQGELQKVADFMKQYTDVAVDIEGHSDDQGAAAYNKKLSQKRADSVKNELTTKYGIDIDRVTATGYGEEKPIASNATPDGRKMNRRVVAVIQKEVRK